MKKRRPHDCIVPFRCSRCSLPLPVVLLPRQPYSVRRNPLHQCRCGLVWELFLTPPRPTSIPTHTFFYTRYYSVPVSCYPLIHSPEDYALIPGIAVDSSDWTQITLLEG